MIVNVVAGHRYCPIVVMSVWLSMTWPQPKDYKCENNNSIVANYMHMIYIQQCMLLQCKASKEIYRHSKDIKYKCV
jgi:hypothetical protein